MWLILGLRVRTSYIDLYCERTSAEYWAEPLNAVTNIAFIVSAIAITVQLRRTSTGMAGFGSVWVLNGLVYCIGVGSWLFHTHAVLWAMLADIIPIAIFILLYTWCALRKIVGTGPWLSFVGVGGVISITLLIQGLSGYKGGAYIAALLALVSIGTWLQCRRAGSAGKALLWGAGLFTVSLAVRSLDHSVCGQITIGIHFVWHIFNSVVLFIVVCALMRHGHFRG